MFRALALAALCALAIPAPALATDGGGGDADGGLPDGSVGQGGADRDNEEGEESAGRVVTRCERSGDCSQGFTCAQGRCRWIGVRQAEGGCAAAGTTLLLPLGAALGLWRGRRRRGQ